MRVRWAEASKAPSGVGRSALASARACRRVASATARVGLSLRACLMVRSRSGEPSAVHQSPDAPAWAPSAGTFEAASPAMA